MCGDETVPTQVGTYAAKVPAAAGMISHSSLMRAARRDSGQTWLLLHCPQSTRLVPETDGPPTVAVTPTSCSSIITSMSQQAQDLRSAAPTRTISPGESDHDGHAHQ